MKKRRLRRCAAFLCAVMLTFAAAAQDVSVLAEPAENEQTAEEVSVSEEEMKGSEETKEEAAEGAASEADEQKETQKETNHMRKKTEPAWRKA